MRSTLSSRASEHSVSGANSTSFALPALIPFRTCEQHQTIIRISTARIFYCQLEIADSSTQEVMHVSTKKNFRNSSPKSFTSSLSTSAVILYILISYLFEPDNKSLLLLGFDRVRFFGAILERGQRSEHILDNLIHFRRRDLRGTK
jgi:hypothetical protein